MMEKLMNTNIAERISAGEDVLLNAADVAAIMKVSKRYVYLLMNNGTIPSVRIGRSIRVYVADLIAYLESLQLNGQS